MNTLRAQIRAFLFAVPPLLASCHCFAASFTSGIQTGIVQNASVTEASGIVASRMNPNVLWMHNDSGDTARVFAMTTSGINLGTYSISGASASDWEDMAVGPGPTFGAQYLYMADIGDNNAVRTSISVYRVPEPVVSDVQEPVSVSISGMAKFTFVYPDGPRDAESMFVDPLTRDIYIISKRENPKHLYKAAYPQSTSGTTTLELMTTFLTDSTWLTAADISPNGNEIIVRSTGDTSGRMYLRPPGGTITGAFNSTPTTIPLASEPQGEAIAFDPSGRGYYTVSEGSNEPIYYFDRLPPPAATVYWDNDGVAAGTYVTIGAGMGGAGTWNSSAKKWYNGSADVPWVGGHNAVFWGTAGTVTLTATQTVNSLTFKTTGYVLTASTVTLAGPSVTVDPGVTATISSVVAGSAGLIKNGAGTLVLTNSANQTSGYTGGTIINAGTLNISSGAVGRSGTPITINNAATLQFTGGFTLAAARSVSLGAGGGIVDVQGFDDFIAGPINGTMLTKTGAGTLSLTNANTYTGGTIINDGKLAVNNASGSGTGSGAVTVNAGATLGGTGAISGAVTVNNGGRLSPGTSSEPLDVGSLTLAIGAVLNFELDTVAGLDTGDLINVTTTDGLTIKGGALNIVDAGSMTAGTYTLIDYSGTLYGSPADITLGTTPAGFNYALVDNITNTSIDVVVSLPGDHNGDQIVDASDYVLWRKSGLSEQQYDAWRNNFGITSSGTGLSERGACGRAGANRSAATR